MAVVYSSGTGGNVRLGAGSTVVAGITKWTLEKRVQIIASPTFGMTADGNGVYWTPKTLLGLADGTAEFSGYYNVGDVTESVVYIGMTVVLDLLFETGTPFGFMNLSGKVTSLSAGSDVKSTDPATFSCKVELSGTVPIASL